MLPLVDADDEDDQGDFGADVVDDEGVGGDEDDSDKEEDDGDEDEEVSPDGMLGNALRASSNTLGVRVILDVHSRSDGSMAHSIHVFGLFGPGGSGNKGKEDALRLATFEVLMRNFTCALKVLPPTSHGHGRTKVLGRNGGRRSTHPHFDHRLSTQIVHIHLVHQER